MNQFQLLKRYLNAGKRVWPDFIIIGAQKAGTTSLYNYLCRHPQMIRAGRKEIHYFDTYYNRGQRWYRAFFPPREDIDKHRAITGEASPSYLFSPQAAARTAGLLPEVKLIVLLRDPARRAISSYLHQVRRGRETRSLEQALVEEDKLIKKIRDNNHTFNNKKLSKQLRRYSYRSRGLYLEQLQRYFAFYPRKHFFIAAAEDFFADPATTLKATQQFLNIDPDFLPADIRPANTTDPHMYELVDPQTEAELREFYRPYNQKLKQELGMDVPWD